VKFINYKYLIIMQIVLLLLFFECKRALLRPFKVCIAKIIDIET